MNSVNHQPDYANEVDLIELFKIVGKRWKLLTVILALHLVLALTYIYWHENSHQYAQKYTMASYYDGEQYQPFVSLDKLSNKITGVYLPEIIYQIKQKQNVNISTKNFELTPIDDFYFKLTASVKPQDKQALSNIYNKLAHKLNDLQKNYVTQKKQYRRTQVNQLRNQQHAFDDVYGMLWKSVKNMNNDIQGQDNNSNSQHQQLLNLLGSTLAKNSNSGAMIDALKQKQKLETQYANLKLSRNTINQGSTSSIRDYGSIGLSKSQILAIALFAGMVLGLILVYFVEYVSVTNQARKRGQADKQ